MILMLLISYGINAQNDTLKNETLQEVVIIKKKKAVEHLPDRTIYDFSEQAILNSGSLLEGLKKLPGLIASESVDLMYQGRSLDVYMDGRPLRISGSSLISYLEGLPANSVESVEIITNPGAEYDASSGNAIINIISSRKASNFTTLVYSTNYSFSNYDKFRNKVRNRIFLSSKTKKLNWKINLGQSYKEDMMNNTITEVLNINKDKNLKYYYIRPSLSLNLENSRIGIDYEFSNNKTDNTIDASDNIYKTKDKMYTNELATTFQKIYDDSQKKFEIAFVYYNLNNKFNQNIIQKENISKQDIYTFKIDYSTPVNFLDNTKLSIGGKYFRENMLVNDNNILSLDLNRNTASLYAEAQSKLKDFNFIAGLRAEKYYNKGVFVQSNLLYNSYKVFPNVSIQYNIMNPVFVSVNYNKKIKLPSINNLNPNNIIFQNSKLTYNGNPYLQPIIYDSFGIKFSAFDYVTLSYDFTYAKNDIFFLVERKDDSISYLYKNSPHMKLSTFSFGLPIPLMLFSKGLKELMEFNFDINDIDVLYLYADYQKFKSPVIENQRGIWSFFVSGQFILPTDINFQVIYKITSTGNYKYFLIDKPFQNNLDINISKKFLSNNLHISIYGNDILNTNKTVVRTLPLLNGISTTQKSDSRSFGISLNYKISNSSKNKKNNIDKKEDYEKENYEKDVLISN